MDHALVYEITERVLSKTFGTSLVKGEQVVLKDVLHDHKKEKKYKYLVCLAPQKILAFILCIVSNHRFELKVNSLLTKQKRCYVPFSLTWQVNGVTIRLNGLYYYCSSFEREEIRTRICLSLSYRVPAGYSS